jgi:DNA-binding MarR family transcriptional regulator
MNNYLGKLFKSHHIELTAEQFKVMLFLWKKEYGSQQDIADLLGKDKTTITRLLEGLEKKGYILRQTDNIDKRSKRVIATLLGKSLESKVMPLISQSNERIKMQFTFEELECAKKVLKSLCELHHNPF